MGRRKNYAFERNERERAKAAKREAKAAAKAALRTGEQPELPEGTEESAATPDEAPSPPSTDS